MTDWSLKEVELIVADYFRMLSLELAGKNYSKTEHRKSLIKLLNDRPEGAIEFKHQNITAVLIKLGSPYIKGYKPLSNYQKILEEKVSEYLRINNQIEDQFMAFAEDQQVFNSGEVDFNNFLVKPPVLEQKKPSSLLSIMNPVKINYLEKEQQNSQLGLAGEELVLKFEKWNLLKLGKSYLADQVRWISREDGDGCGFDILSKNSNGTDKYLEVKTTKLRKENPFYFTSNELAFSQKNSKDYHLYRVFNFNEDAKMFIKNGSLDKICHSLPINFKGFF